MKYNYIIIYGLSAALILNNSFQNKLMLQIKITAAFLTSSTPVDLGMLQFLLSTPRMVAKW